MIQPKDMTKCTCCGLAFTWTPIIVGDGAVACSDECWDVLLGRAENES